MWGGFKHKVGGRGKEKINEDMGEKRGNLLKRKERERE